MFYGGGIDLKCKLYKIIGYGGGIALKCKFNKIVDYPYC